MDPLIELPPFLSLVLDGSTRCLAVTVLGSLAFSVLAAGPAADREVAGRRLLDPGNRIAWMATVGLAGGLAATMAAAGVVVTGPEAVPGQLVALGLVLVVLVGTVLRGEERAPGLPLFWFVLLAAALPGALGPDRATLTHAEHLVASVYLLGAGLAVGGLPALVATGSAGAATVRRRLLVRAAGPGVLGCILVTGARLLMAEERGVTLEAWASGTWAGTNAGLLSAAELGLWATLLVVWLALGWSAFRRPGGGADALRPPGLGPEDQGQVVTSAWLGAGLGAAALFAMASFLAAPVFPSAGARLPTVGGLADRLALDACDLKKPSPAVVPAPTADPDDPGFASSEPPPGIGPDAWQFYTDRWAGLMILIIGLLAMLEQSGEANWARFWPLLLFILIGFLLNQSDPEAWPLAGLTDREGVRSLWLPDLLRNRVVLLLLWIVACAEWSWRAGFGTAEAGIRVAGAAAGAAAVAGLMGAPADTAGFVAADRALLETGLALVGLLVAGARWFGAGRLRSGIVNRLWAGGTVAIGVALLLYRPA